METEKSNSDWSDLEIEAAVDAYLSMLSREQSGQKVIKTEENRILRDGALAERTKGSVEFRMQNISTVLDEMGLPRIDGYKPAKNVGTNVKNKIRAILDKKNLVNLNTFTQHKDGKCAWVFQYTPGSSFERRWLSSPERNQTIPWEVSRFQDLVREGDLVFFWQADKNGGLRGWGEIESGEVFAVGDRNNVKNYRIGVRESCWLDPLIPRNSIFSSGIINRRGDILNGDPTSPLSPDEALEFSNFFPASERPNTKKLITHTQRSKNLKYAPTTTDFTTNNYKVKQVQNEEALEVLFHSDDPWAIGLEDKIGVLDEAKAMAALAIRSEEPPLAIGILGNWGTGKSFFMRLIYQQIKKQSADTVLIRFNAWHFVDNNLWASLVDHIFTELDQWVRKKETAEKRKHSSEQLFENLSTAQELALEAAEELVNCRKAQAVATERLAKAEQNTKLFWHAVVQTLKSNVTWKKIQTAADSLGLGELFNNTQKLKETIDDLNTQITRTKAIKEGLLQRLGSLPVIICGVAIILIAPPAISKIYTIISNIFQTEVQSFTKELLTLSAPILGITSGIAWLTNRVRRAVNEIANFRTTLEDAISHQTTLRSESLSKLSADMETARDLLTTTTEKLVEATREFDAGTGRGRMLRFIRQRANDGHYASHLGLVATIRKDFEELSRGLRADPEATPNRHIDESFRKRVQDLLDDPKNHLKETDKEKLESMLKSISTIETQSFKRVVLFIDDLDRCPPEKVVEVLQAVHLLLGFPLFIVFVAADVRWVNRALTKHYPDLLNNPQNENTNNDSGATAHDYLEKIFQIPYWVRPMSDDASSALLESRIRKIGKSIAPNPFSEPEKNTLLEQHQSIDDINPAIDEIDTDAVNNDLEDFDYRASRLSFSDAERDFLSQLAPFSGNSPRRVLRFINTYRIIKISLSDEENESLEQRYFRELLLQLTINTGAPEVFGDWSSFLQQHADAPDMSDLLEKMREQTWYNKPSVNRVLQGAVHAYLNTKTSGNVRDAVEASKLVKRYSFIG
ncbi:KAP family NTPase [Pseudomonas baetica]|uniref:P-loop NTPase fold protein n=1 Tax=Pseudomonas baetica TaxID=674054 RepID=UPI001C8BD875|nr:P-loop NTPase fold protein [Pseudomonas baetica]MBX9406238.1 KAP family NTPase [Pseudomonas baetica]